MLFQNMFFFFFFCFVFLSILINLYLGLVEEGEKTYIYGPPPGSTKPTTNITKHISSCECNKVVSAF